MRMIFFAQGCDKTLRLIKLGVYSYVFSFFPIEISAQYNKVYDKQDFKDLPEGLSQNSVNAFIEDSQGFMWIGTDDGLNKFDGYQFTIYRYDPANNNSISHSLIRTIAQDKNEDIWIGAERGGLNLYDPFIDGFVNFEHQSPDGDSLSRSSIYDLMVDRDNVIWVATNRGLIHFDADKKEFIPSRKVGPQLVFENVGILEVFQSKDGKVWIRTDGEGLWVYDPDEGKLSQFTRNEEPGSLSSNDIRSIYQDRDNNVWIGTAAGLNLYNEKTNDFEWFDRSSHRKLSSDNIWAISENGQGELVIGTDGGGLNILNGQSFRHFIPGENVSNGINDNVIRELYRDSQNNLWIGTFRGGVNLLSPHHSNFHTLRKGESTGLDNNSILAIAESNDHGIWVGTDGGGLNYLDYKSGRFSKEKISNINWNESDRVALSILEDYHGGLWIGTFEGGLAYVPPNKPISHFVEDPQGLINNSVWTIYEDSKNQIWVGTNGGINFYNRATNAMDRVEAESSNSLIDNQNSVRAILEDSEGSLWFGVMGGLKKIDPHSFKVTPYFFEGNKKNYLTFAIHEGGDGKLWLGTFGGGLILFDPKAGITDSFRVSDGLPSDAIYGILEDEQGRLWLSTGKGISRFDPQERSFSNYSIEDGLQGNQFNRGAFLKDEFGYFWFGGTEGLNVFHPDSVEHDDIAPQVVFTDFKVFNQSVRPGEKGVVSDQIYRSAEIQLDHFQSVITLEFAGLNYASPERTRYAFFMEGFDKGWRYVDKQRSATYTNLYPGKYIFHVKASNNVGSWGDKETTIHIIINPPWWKTWWAYLCYALMVGLLLLWARRIIVYRERLKTNLKLEHLELTHLQEIDQMKSRFFANISHELRTPLTLILDPLKLMYDREAHPKVQKQLKVMIRNAQRLLRLINQLLDLSKIEEGSMKLEKRNTDIVQWFKQVLPAFATFADQHNIHFSLSLPSEVIIMNVDQEKLEKIVSNLLSNALKFTQNKGKIKVDVKLLDDNSVMEAGTDVHSSWLEIHIADTGVGIPADRIKYVFDRFYQVDGAHHREQEGSGIGLSLTKELVELHGGKIRIDSEEGLGTDAYVYLPISHHAVKQENADQTDNQKSDLLTQLKSTVFSRPKEISTAKASQRAPLILIVEDNPDVSAYIADILGDKYRITEAVNGKEGITIAVETSPDLIISDVMMPVIDGIELTETLKNDQRTSHIPIILLTAKAEEEDVFEGINIGADDYVVKPFDSKLLEARVQNLIKSRELLRDKFANNKVINLEPKEVTATPVDELFLKNALTSVEANIANSEFTVEDFGDEVGLSRMQLYRKLKALTNQSPNEFIRTVRLKRAAQLIHLDEMTISQITYEVGFNDLQYFRDCFKKHFGVNPSDYSSQSKPQSRTADLD